MNRPTHNFSNFDHHHWSRVKAERARLGLPGTEGVGEVVKHPLTGRYLREDAFGKTYFVRSVRKHWSQGWYLRAWLECDGLHRTIVVDNLSSNDPLIGQQLSSYADSFTALQ